MEKFRVIASTNKKVVYQCKCGKIAKQGTKEYYQEIEGRQILVSKTALVCSVCENKEVLY